MNRLTGFFTKKPASSSDASRDVLAEELAARVERNRTASAAAPEGPNPPAASSDRPPASGGSDGALMVLSSLGGFPVGRHGDSTMARTGAGGEVPQEIINGIDPKVLKLLTPQFAHELRALPVRASGTQVVIAVDETVSTERHHQLHCLVAWATEGRRDLSFVVIPNGILEQSLERYYPWSSNVHLIPSNNDLVNLFLQTASKTDSRVLRVKDLGPLSTRSLVERLLIKGVTRGAADIVFEPGEQEYRIRYKVEGECEPACAALPPNAGPTIASIIKQMGDMNIAEREQTQDGQFSFKIDVGGGQLRDIQFRVALTPTIHGEELTIRLHDNSERKYRLDSIKADPRTHEALWNVVNMKRGFVLLCGPTASGKTTTLAALLSECDGRKERIVTIEDPVEIRISSASAQTPVNAAKGQTFGVLTANLLRRTPDRVLVGEIRDAETAYNAIKIATTGHQVLSTVHCDYAGQVVSRLTQEGISPFNLGSALTLCIAQRLLNLLCEHCAVPVDYDRDVLLAQQFADVEIPYVRAREAKGCALCHWKGTNGRQAIYETLIVDPEIKAIIIANRPTVEEEIEVASVRKGMRPLRRSALDLVKQGKVSLTQVAAICREMSPDVLEIVRQTVSAGDTGFDASTTGEWAYVRRPALAPVSGIHDGDSDTELFFRPEGRRALPAADVELGEDKGTPPPSPEPVDGTGSHALAEAPPADGGGHEDCPAWIRPIDDAAPARDEPPMQLETGASAPPAPWEERPISPSTAAVAPPWDVPLPPSDAVKPFTAESAGRATAPSAHVSDAGTERTERWRRDTFGEQPLDIDELFVSQAQRPPSDESVRPVAGVGYAASDAAERVARTPTGASAEAAPKAVSQGAAPHPAAEATPSSRVDFEEIVAGIGRAARERQVPLAQSQTPRTGGVGAQPASPMAKKLQL